MGNQYARCRQGKAFALLGSGPRFRAVLASALCMAFLGGTLLLGTQALATEPPASEALPSPRPVSPPVYRLYTPPLSRDVWQLYDVDYKGFWRPRVAFTPYGDYYLYNGAPYPWAQMYPHWFRSRVRGD